jgi:hypothetical protein
MSEFKPKFDFKDIDINKIDPDRIDLGIGQQDCMLIATAFERGAHSTPTEAAVFSTLTRSLQNNKQLAETLSKNLEGYLASPEKTTTAASGYADEFSQNDGTSAQTEHDMQSFNIGNQNSSTVGPDFGKQLLEWARDCIPCGLRLASFLEIHPNINLLNTLEDFLKQQLSFLTDVTKLLTNFDSFGDFCKLLNLLSFMCIPDLQRIIALLMALFMLKVPKFDGLIGMLQALIVPIFAPILMAISSLLDQFVLLIVSPLNCVSDALKQQVKKLNVESPFVSIEVNADNNPLDALSGGLKQLDNQLQEGIQEVRNKMNFYLSQVKAMLSEMGGGDAAYLKAKLDVLNLVRMLAFIAAIIAAISKGHAACSSEGDTQATSEDINSFFNNFLNPQAAFTVWMDEEGKMHVDEKVKNFDSAIDESGSVQNIANPSNFFSPLPQAGNMIQFEGEDLLDTQIVTQITTMASTLSMPVRAAVPCYLETSVEDIQKVNQWITELNS